MASYIQCSKCKEENAPTQVYCVKCGNRLAQPGSQLSQQNTPERRMPQIKILMFNISVLGRQNVGKPFVLSIPQAEAEIARLVSEGWRIMAAGGNEPNSFVVLQKDG